MDPEKQLGKVQKADKKLAESSAETSPSRFRMDRRVLLKGAAAASAAILAEQNSVLAGTCNSDARKHYVPADKKLDSDWVEALFAKGERKVYLDRELETIGMPCGGICAGQLYVRGDGTLARWWIANNAHKTGTPPANQEIETPLGSFKAGYQTYRPEGYVDQGFAVRAKLDGEKPVVRTLDGGTFDDIHFVGEYPIATIDYRNGDETILPVDVQLEVFSPFIPLNPRDSAQPATVLRCTVTNRSNKPADVSVAGWLQNVVCFDWEERKGAYSRNILVRHSGLTSIQMDLRPPLPKPSKGHRVVVFEDFENGTYQDWQVEGEAFGEKPAETPPPGFEFMKGWKGKYFANSLADKGNQSTGRLISKTFLISERYIVFLMGSGHHRGQTCLNLIVDGEVRRSDSGKGDPSMQFHWWDVEDLIGSRAHFEIVDQTSAPWGHITIDHIYFTNNLPESASSPRQHPQFGNMTLSVFDSQASATAQWESTETVQADFAESGKLDSRSVAESPLGTKLCGAVASSFQLQPGEKRDATFLLTWYFPNRRQHNRFVAFGAPSGTGPIVGNMYANWYNSSFDVARYIRENFERLDRQTHLFRDTYFDTTLPYWFAQRIAMQVSTLSTETCQWWANGRFWGFEGVGCCPGTCNHVWHYEQAMARLFPELQRSVLSMQTFDPQTGFVEDSGMVLFRGEGWDYERMWWGEEGPDWAADGQAAEILMALREHQYSSNNNFLRNHWPYIRRALEFLIEQDSDTDGVIEGMQPNTYDVSFYGANTMVGSLYLAALRAGEELARTVGETTFADKCHRIYQSGRKRTAKQLFNGEYFVQQVDLQQYPKWQYADGCLSDQLIGQTWANQLDLGYLYPRDQVVSALKSIWRYNWAPDVATQINDYSLRVQLASPGEAGLLLCTWPKSKHPGNSAVRYRDQVWTGIEFQVAAAMIHEGLLTEGLSIVRAVHDRYDGAKHNPWNLILCGDHYSRAMASWSCLLAVSGYIFDASTNKIGFAPRMNPEYFKSFFTASEGWGSLVQKRCDHEQYNSIELKWGTLRVQTLQLEIPSGKEVLDTSIKVGVDPSKAVIKQDGRRLTILLETPQTLRESQTIEIQTRY